MYGYFLVPAFVLAGGFFAGLAGVPNNLGGVASPKVVLARDRKVAVVLMLPVGSVFLLAGAGVMGLIFGLQVGLTFGLLVGLAFGLGLSMGRTAWPSYMLTRVWLAFRHQLPWSLMRFLEDAHQRGILRQTGAVYQFRHIELQHRLANRWTLILTAAQVHATFALAAATAAVTEGK